MSSACRGVPGRLYSKMHGEKLAISPRGGIMLWDKVPWSAGNIVVICPWLPSLVSTMLQILHSLFTPISGKELIPSPCIPWQIPLVGRVICWWQVLYKGFLHHFSRRACSTMFVLQLQYAHIFFIVCNLKIYVYCSIQNIPEIFWYYLWIGIICDMQPLIIFPLEGYSD